MYADQRDMSHLMISKTARIEMNAIVKLIVVRCNCQNQLNLHLRWFRDCRMAGYAVDPMLW